MKIGFNLYLWTDWVKPVHYPILRDLKTTGYDGVEVPLLNGEVSEFRALATVLDDLGLERTSAGAFISADRDPLSLDKAVRQAALDDATRQLDRANAVGAKLMVGPYYQVLGQFTGEGPSADELARIADFHRELGDIAAARDVVIALEPLNRFEAYILNLAKDAQTHVRRVNHPNIKMMFDTFHANIEELNGPSAFTATVADTVHFHVSENDRGVPGRGHVPFADYFKAVKASGYDGWLTIEAFGRGLPAMAAACRIWRDMSERPEEVYLEGFQTIKNGLAAA